MSGAFFEKQGQREALARRWGMPAETVDAWLLIEPLAWVLENAKHLHAAGMSPQDAKDLHDRLDPQVRASIGRLVDAGRMAALDTAYLHRWAAAGLLKPDVVRTRRGGVTFSFTRWVTEARRYIAAAGGDQRLAALAAAAGLDVEETAARWTAGDLDEEALAMLAAFGEANRVFGTPDAGTVSG